MNESFFHDGVIKQTKFLLKKQVNEFIRVKIVIILNFLNVKIILMVFMSKK